MVSINEEVNIDDTRDEVNIDECRGNVEVWIGKLEENMINTMKDLSKKCFEELKKFE